MKNIGKKGENVVQRKLHKCEMNKKVIAFKCEVW